MRKYTEISLKIFFFQLFILNLIAPVAAKTPPELDQLKPIVRDVCESLNKLFPAEETVFNEGMHRVDIPGATGIILDPKYFSVVPYVWNTSEGLLEIFEKRQEKSKNLEAAVNGTFYCANGPLGQIIINGKKPSEVKQICSKIPKCFFSVLQDPENGSNKWAFGETSFNSEKIISQKGRGLSFNRPVKENEKILHLLGGGGWIVRNYQDVHMEAYKNQKFRFRKVDQDSRHTVLAMDRNDNLYILIFEQGQNLETISAKLLDQKFFTNITDAIFFDGGSSSTLVTGDNYLVSPLYFYDKVRFSALLVFRNEKTKNKNSTN
ncbi:MAG: phosphodiester glycosidase family protein [Candidatus Riflebacteria bacterium]|nr:phosphodiester glycosidase family protein [Candidatus Riflebacteria bacterium]